MKPSINSRYTIPLLKNLSSNLKLFGANSYRFQSRYGPQKPSTPINYRELDQIPSDESILNKIFNRKSLPVQTKLQNIFNKRHGIYLYYRNKVTKAKKESQIFNQERYSKLGPDLSAAYYVLHRGGAVKFQNFNQWMRTSDKSSTPAELPTNYSSEYVLTGIDISNLSLLYESLTNFTSLPELTHLSISNCEHANDWWLDYISGELSSLRHLNLTGCSNITYRGLSALYRLDSLETLIIKDLPYSPFLEMTCLQLEELFPNLRIIGPENWEIYKLPDTSDSEKTSSVNV